MSYGFVLSKQVERYLGSLDAEARARIARQIDALCINPFGADSHALHGRLADRRTCQVGGLRIVFAVDVAAQTLHVSSVGPRGDIYKGR